MKALHFQDSTKYALNIKNLFFKAHGKDGLISEKKKKKGTTLLVYPSTDVPNYISKGEKSKFSDLKG